MRVQEHLLPLILMFALPLGGASAAEPLADLAGTWRGADVVAATGIELQPADLDRTIEIDGDGFSMAWTIPLVGAVDFTFVPGPAADVFQVQPGGGGLIARVFPPETGNPLDGDRLIWARRSGDALVVYGLAIDEAGRFLIDRQLQVRDGDGMRVEFSRLRHGQPAATAVGRLQREGG